jgi:hypothetical protein
MLPHPIAYIVLVLPICTIAFCTSSDTPLRFPAIVSTAALFVLSGFFNVVLFCTTRNALPGSWKEKFGIATTSYGFPDDASLPSLTDTTRRLTKTGRKSGAKPAPGALSITVEKDVEINYDEAERTSSSFPTEPLRARDDMQRDDSYAYYIREISFPPPLRIRLEGDNIDKDLSAGVHPASKASRVARKVPEHPGYPHRGHEGGMRGPPLGFKAPSPVYPFYHQSMPTH